MKHLPWYILAAVLAYPVLAQLTGGVGQVSTLRGPVKILGQPAASEWIDIESNDAQAGAVTYIVPPGKVLVLVSLWVAGDGSSLQAQVRVKVDGVVQANLYDWVSREMHGLVFATTDGSGADQPAFLVLREGHVLEFERKDPGGPPNYYDAKVHAFLRGWLEDIP